MRISHVFESIDESNTRKPTKEENVVLLERKKRSLLHELKILSQQMNHFIVSGAVSQMGEASKHPNATVMPESDSRCILTEDPHTHQKVLKVFGRFAIVKEILTTSVLKELEQLQNEGKETVS